MHKWNSAPGLFATVAVFSSINWSLNSLHSLVSMVFLQNNDGVRSRIGVRISSFLFIAWVTTLSLSFLISKLIKLFPLHRVIILSKFDSEYENALVNWKKYIEMWVMVIMMLINVKFLAWAVSSRFNLILYLFIISILNYYWEVMMATIFLK